MCGACARTYSSDHAGRARLLALRPQVWLTSVRYANERCLLSCGMCARCTRIGRGRVAVTPARGSHCVRHHRDAMGGAAPGCVGRHTQSQGAAIAAHALDASQFFVGLPLGPHRGGWCMDRVLPWVPSLHMACHACTCKPRTPVVDLSRPAPPPRPTQTDSGGSGLTPRARLLLGTTHGSGQGRRHPSIHSRG